MTIDQTQKDTGCNMPYEFCTTKCEHCHEVGLLNEYNVYICYKCDFEVLPKELDLTPGVGQ